MLTLSSQPRSRARRPALEGDVVLSERAIALLRARLGEMGLSEWRIFHGQMPYLAGIDNVLERLDPSAVWEAAGPSLESDESMVVVTFDDEPKPAMRVWPSGVLYLRKLEVIIARWYWYNTHRRCTTAFTLVAAPQAERVEALRQALVKENRSSPEPVWQILGEYGDGAKVPRGQPRDELVLNPAVMERVQSEIVGFYKPEVAAMYRQLGVPYRRGVLLYGEPGNGKTSLIRRIGAELPGVAALLLRAGAKFDTDELTEAFATWKQLAPAMLVIEDLTAIIAQVNLSTLLNLLDGVDRRTDGGLLLIATTNYPEKLDPALANRPGRFDVSIELPPPDEAARLMFLRSRLIEIDLAVLQEVAGKSDGLSFSHMEELVQQSGMAAIRAGRAFRSVEDVQAALENTRAAFNTARGGYAKLLDVPFGLRPRRM